MTLTIGSLFSGYGGLDMAVEATTGATPAWFVEYDEAPSKILAHHWPDVPNYGDVTKVDWATMPPVDIITGGSPCQDLSSAGKREGMTEGTRSNLWVNMREAINIIRPRLVVWENVLGALSATATSDSDMEPGTGLLGDGGGGHLRALGRVLGDLAEIGYDAEWTTIRASNIGAPHHRARVFLIAYPVLSDAESVGQLHGARSDNGPAHREVGLSGHDCDTIADPGSIRRERGQGGQARGGVSPLGGETIGAADRPAEDATDSPSVGSGGCVKSRIGGVRQAARGGRPNVPSDAHVIGPEAGHQHPIGHVEEVPVADGRGKTLPDHDGERRDGRNSDSGEAGRGQSADDSGNRIDWGDYTPAVRRWEQLTRPAPSPTELNRNNKPRLASPFAEWMMGLPEGHVTQVPGLSRADQLKAIGNGVCPQQATVALTALLEMEDNL